MMTVPEVYAVVVIVQLGAIIGLLAVGLFTRR